MSVILIKQKPLNRGSHCISQDYYYVQCKARSDACVGKLNYALSYLVLHYYNCS